MKNDYTSDGHNSVFCGKIEIARAYIGENGFEVRVLQGTPRSEVIKKVCEECPEFAKNNHIDENYYPRLFCN